MDTAIVGREVRLRPATKADAGWIAAVLAHPDVARWWGNPRETPAEQALLVLGDGEVDTFAVEVGDDAVGFIQCHEEGDPQYRHAGIDIALHPDWRGRGLGTDAVRALAHHLVHDRGHHRLTIDPAAANEAAIRSYRKVGFRPVGLLRDYEQGLDGTWHDGLLMDLLAAELT